MDTRPSAHYKNELEEKLGGELVYTANAITYSLGWQMKLSVDNYYLSISYMKFYNNFSKIVMKDDGYKEITSKHETYKDVLLSPLEDATIRVTFGWILDY